jgi:hypothetical protein
MRLDAKSGITSGDAEPLTKDVALSMTPSLSADGDWLA